MLVGAVYHRLQVKRDGWQNTAVQVGPQAWSKCEHLLWVASEERQVELWGKLL